MHAYEYDAFYKCLHDFPIKSHTQVCAGAHIRMYMYTQQAKRKDTKYVPTDDSVCDSAIPVWLV